jgi:hypothetical protein
MVPKLHIYPEGAMNEDDLHNFHKRNLEARIFDKEPGSLKTDKDGGEKGTLHGEGST